MRRRTVRALLTVLVVIITFSAIYLLVLEKPIKASPDQLTLTQSDLPASWNITNSYTYYANGSKEYGWGGDWSWAWDHYISLYRDDGNYSAGVSMSCFNSSGKAHLAYLQDKDAGWAGSSWRYENFGVGDEGVRITNMYGGDVSYIFRDGNIMVIVGFAKEEGTLQYEPWMDDMIVTIADKINQYDIPVHI